MPTYMLKEFYQIFAGSWIQTFDDTKSGKSLVRSFPMCEMQSKWNEITELNKQGAGVYFTPNPCEGGRKASNVVKIDWVFVDLDTGTKEAQMDLVNNSPLPPTIIIESKNGYHVYWKCSCSEKQFKFIFSGLQRFFDCDPACKDISRVLRLPPFMHMKDEKDPFQIKIKSMDLKLEYFSDEMIDSFPCKIDYNQDDIEIIKQIPVKDILDNLGVKYNKQNFIIEDGKVTSASINIRKNYINRFSGKPGSGSTIDVMMAYAGVGKEEAIKRLKSLAGIEEKRIESGFVTRNECEELELHTQPYTWGTTKSDEIISPIERHHFVLLAGETGSGKTAYSFFMACKNAELGHKVLFISLEMPTDKIVSRVARESAAINKSQWRTRAISETQKQKYKNKKKEITGKENLTMYGFPDGLVKNFDNIEKIIKRSKPDIIFLDNFDLIEQEGRNTIDKETKKADKLMAWTTSNNIPIVVLHHFNKGNDKDLQKARSINSLKGSSKISHNSDMVVVGYRDFESESDEDKAKFTLLQRKDRDFGVGGVCTVYFYKGDFLDEFPSYIDRSMANL